MRFVNATVWLLLPLGGCALGTRARSNDALAIENRAAPSHDCGTCHSDIARQWSESMHGRAFTDPFFQASYGTEPLAFCVRCHAPALASRDGDGVDALLARSRREAERGIGCTDCHGPGAPRTMRRSGRAPHAVTVDTNFGTRSCVTCHEFTQPGAQDPLQSTAKEHHASSFAAASCTDCHMETHGGGKDHRFLAGVRNVARMKASIAPRITKQASGKLRVVLTTIGVGHAFPTGDLFRRLRLEVDAVDGEGRTEARSEWTFGRSFHTSGGVRTEAGDRRIRDEAIEIVDAPDGRSRREDRLRFRLYYERGIAEHGGRFVVGDSTLLHEGAVSSE